MKFDLDKTTWVDSIKANIEEKLMRRYGKEVQEASATQVYLACAYTVRDAVMENWRQSREQLNKQDLKRLYYISVEFLQGRALGNNLINLGITDYYVQALKELGFNLNEVEEQESDPGLGNGGLGRLASCFLDSLATLNLPAMGCGIRYEYGLFRQKILDCQQIEVPDDWLGDTGCPWEIVVEEDAVEVRFGGDIEEVWEDGSMRIAHTGYQCVKAVPYDMPIVGYDIDNISTLRLWSARAMESIDMASFSRGEYMRALEDKELAEVISKVLYPADDHKEGKLLRLRQHYFFTSATVQYIINNYKRYHSDLTRLSDKVTIQINDTHPALAIPEFMRILLDEEGMDWDTAWQITTRVFNYTNHTVMAEALESWPEDLFKQLLPRIYTIVQTINDQYCQKLWAFYPGQWERIGQMAIVGYNQIRMANLCIAGSRFVNGVSGLHGEILKQSVFKNFFMVEPWKYLGITNGVTFRRWMLHANPGLTKLAESTIGPEFKHNFAKLEDLVPHAQDPAFQEAFMAVKRENKVRLSNWLHQRQGVLIDPDSMFDVQAKRLHEYKRQHLNALHIIYLYDKLRNDPSFEMQPTTFIFGAKASPGYTLAKQIIRLICVLAKKIDELPAARGKLKVVFLENYNVSAAEVLIPAADVSQQISTAGKEASGTGNMKFMLNGALTLGTMDGANVEMYEAVGEDNIFIFGLRSEEVDKLKRYGNYSAGQEYEKNPDLQVVMEYLVSGALDYHGTGIFQDIYHVLLFGDNGQVADPFFVLKDFDAYKKAHAAISSCYADQASWRPKAIMNTAKSGVFSSDRTITEYNERIWNLDRFSMYY